MGASDIFTAGATTRVPSYPTMQKRVLQGTDEPGISGDVGEEALVRTIMAMTREAVTPAEVRRLYAGSWESEFIRAQTMATILAGNEIPCVIGNFFDWDQYVLAALDGLTTGHVVLLLGGWTRPHLMRWYLAQNYNGSYWTVLDPYTDDEYALKLDPVGFDGADLAAQAGGWVVRTKTCAYDDPELTAVNPSKACRPSPLDSGTPVGGNWPPPWEDWPPGGSLP